METNWSQVGNEDLNSSASQVLNIQGDIEQSLHELVSIPIIFSMFKMRKKLYNSFKISTNIKDLIVEKTISIDTFYSKDRILKNDTDEAPHELFTEQMDQGKKCLSSY